jgi:hypothetical protein
MKALLLLLLTSCLNESQLIQRTPSSVHEHAYLKLPGPDCNGGRVQIIYRDHDYEVGSQTNKEISTLISSYNAQLPKGATESQTCLHTYHIQFSGKMDNEFLWPYGEKVKMDVIHLEAIEFI